MRSDFKFETAVAKLRTLERLQQATVSMKHPFVLASLDTQDREMVYCPVFLPSLCDWRVGA